MSVTQAWSGCDVVKMVGGQQRGVPRDGPWGFIAALGLDSVLPHDSGDTMLATKLPDFTQVAQNAAGSIDSATGPPRVANQTQQSGIFFGVV